MINKLYLTIIVVLLTACSSDEGTIMTVNGPLDSNKLGRSLIHEHVLVDFIGADSTGYHRWDRTEAFNMIRPYLEAVKEQGIESFFEYTPAFLGRDPVLLKMLSDSIGLNIITNTGLYGAVDNKFLPFYAYKESADQLSNRWIDEFRNGIEDTGIRPGFIKISVNPGELSELHEKIVRAAARTHMLTGLTIASHTGPALPAFEEINILKEEGVAPEAFVWVHAQNEKDLDQHVRAAREGAWISFDGLGESNMNDYLGMIMNMKEAGYLYKVLLSHDAGWYTPGEEGGGDYRAHTVLAQNFIPFLLDNDFTEKEIEQLVEKNPAEAFRIRKKLILD